MINTKPEKVYKHKSLRLTIFSDKGDGRPNVHIRHGFRYSNGAWFYYDNLIEIKDLIDKLLKDYPENIWVLDNNASE